jgi:plant 4,4-dimethylsterol C-4alpha-methyl-monooxygenase
VLSKRLIPEKKQGLLAKAPPTPIMISYATIAEAEAALGRSLSTAETFWFNYSATMPDYLLYYHNLLFLFVVFTLVPLPIALIELWFPRAVAPYKIQPKVNLAPVSFIKCYMNVFRVFVFVIGPLQLSSYPTIKVRRSYICSKFIL